MTKTHGDRRMPIETRALAPGGRDATAWAVVRDRLETPELYRTYWLTTLHRDGRPHAMPLLGLWLDGAFYFLTGERTRKGRDLARDARCVLTVAITSLPAVDVSVEGNAARVTDDATIRRIVEAYATELHWPLTIEQDGVHGPNAPTAGPSPYRVYELITTTVFGLPGVAGTNERAREPRDRSLRRAGGSNSEPGLHPKSIASIRRATCRCSCAPRDTLEVGA